MNLRAALISGLLSCCLLLSGASAGAMDAPPMTAGQTVYVPVYSHVMHGNQDRNGKVGEWLLSAMLSVRNTDPSRPITVRSIRYYDTNGKLIREYPAGRTLGPLATMEVFVENKDRTGGSGANFLIVWAAEQPVNAPIVEAVHTNFFGTQSVAFTSAGQPLHIDAR